MLNEVPVDILVVEDSLRERDSIIDVLKTTLLSAPVQKCAGGGPEVKHPGC